LVEWRKFDQLRIDSGNPEHAEAPIIQFTDSSFQDCPDTSRSTGGYLTFMQGAVVDAVSTMPTIVSQSTCEAEHCMDSLAVMAGCYTKKLYNEIAGYHSDRPLTIPLGTDYKSAMDTANSPKETNRTRHKHCSRYKEPTTLPTVSRSHCQLNNCNWKLMYFRSKLIHEWTRPTVVAKRTGGIQLARLDKTDHDCATLP
jgi:hypothetical protein